MRLIDADALKKAIIKHLCVKSENNLLPAEKSIYDLIDKQPKVELLKERQIEIKRPTRSGEWKRMSDLPIEKDDRFECSICGNVVHYHDRINLYTFNDYCGRCGAYNGFKFKDGDQ